MEGTLRSLWRVKLVTERTIGDFTKGYGLEDLKPLIK